MNCTAKSRTTGRRCGNTADDPELEGLCVAHGNMIRDGRELEHFEGGAIGGAPRAAAEPVQELELEEPAPSPPPSVQERPDRGGIPADLFAIPVHDGPESEPAAAVASPPPPPELEGGGTPPPGGATATAPAGPAPYQLTPGPWRKQAERVLRGGVNPALRRGELEELDPSEIEWAAEVFGACAADVMKDADPNNPWGAAAICGVTLGGPRFLEWLERKKRGGAPPGGAPRLEVVPPSSSSTEDPIPGGWDRPRAGSGA